MSRQTLNYKELQKYFNAVERGNVIAARLENGQISFHTATILFKSMYEKLTEEIESENLS